MAGSWIISLAPVSKLDEIGDHPESPSTLPAVRTEVVEKALELFPVR